MKNLFHSIIILGLLTTNAVAVDEDNPEQFIGLMSRYLDLANQVVDTANRPEATVFLAIEGIFEIYEQRRDVSGAERHLKQLIDSYGNDRTLRNLVRLKLRDVYKESGQSEKALEQLDLLIKENAQ